MEHLPVLAGRGGQTAYPPTLIIRLPIAFPPPSFLATQARPALPTAVTWPTGSDSAPTTSSIPWLPPALTSTPSRAGWPRSRTAPPATIARRLSTLSGFYRYAVNKEAISRNPVASVRRPKVGTETASTGLDRNELSALVHAAEADSPRSLALVLLLGLNGLRISEVLGSDVWMTSGPSAATACSTLRAWAGRRPPSRWPRGPLRPSTSTPVTEPPDPSS